MNAERKAQFGILAKKLKGMTEAQKVNMILNRGIVNVKGKALSLHNNCLLLLQANGTTPTVVGGYRQWKVTGRQVQKGQHGLMIWYPSRRKVEGEEEKVNFYVGTVFDISQTKEAEA